MKTKHAPFSALMSCPMVGHVQAFASHSSHENNKQSRVQEAIVVGLAYLGQPMFHLTFSTRLVQFVRLVALEGFMGGCPKFSKVEIMPTQITPSNFLCYVSLNRVITEYGHRKVVRAATHNEQADIKNSSVGQTIGFVRFVKFINFIQRSPNHVKRLIAKAEKLDCLKCQTPFLLQKVANRCYSNCVEFLIT